LLVAFSKGKLLLLGLTKISTLASMLAFFAVYWSLFGWRFALGFVMSIYIHEMGHVMALRRYNIAASAPMFIPFFGAFVRMKQYPGNVGEDARVGLAGPIWGLGSAVAAWLAALATIPVLFDPLQVILEQYVLTDVWTVLLIMAALALLVTSRHAVAGLLLGVAVTFRDEELIMIVPAVIYLIAARRSLKQLTALVVCFLIPVTAYLGWFDATRGHWNFTTFSGAFLYGRVADFADCTGLSLPAYEKPLCPTQPPAQRVADYYTWNPASPQWTFTVPPGKSRDTVVQDFSRRILEHQPFAYAEAVTKDFLYGFSPVRGAGPEHYSPSYLKFHKQIPPDPQAAASLKAIGIGWPASNTALAGFLQGYWFYIPGPLLAAGLVLGLAGAVIGAVRKGHNQTLLFSLSTIAVLIPPAVFATFDWRYQLPQLTLIPVAAVLGITALTATAGTAESDRPAAPAEDLQAPPPAR